ncbi:uncharacterized protein LOC133204759 [Saccostrea echinata]|uniref:uncharacterized protein LOC133175424 n=1 Tax=Saccostrea echinata TaxID=191078 RepID=UPI002A7ED97C|nr:uncharacterized protein LOC133175424 [Saccostrea echinata]XP_061196486.1 uncharacterized protein LOC133204759 [Saccostrea echinata]
MNTIIFCLFALTGFQNNGILSYTQHFISDNIMSWYAADKACPSLFNPGNGTIHMAVNLSANPQQIQVLRTLNNHESVWLDGFRFHLGCNANSCEYLTIQHLVTSEKLKSICIKDGNRTAQFDCSKGDTYNFTSVHDQSMLHRLTEYVSGEPLKINRADIDGILKQCRLATRTSTGFIINYQNCADKHKVLCQRHSNSTPIVTTLVYKRSGVGDDAEAIFISPSNSKEAGLTSSNFLDAKWLITTGLSAMACFFSVFICIYLCSRKHLPLNSSINSSRRRRNFQESFILPNSED